MKTRLWRIGRVVVLVLGLLTGLLFVYGVLPSPARYLQ
jgi:hypothetical protein